MISHWIAENWMVPVFMIGGMLAGAGIAFLFQNGWEAIKRWLS